MHCFICTPKGQSKIRSRIKSKFSPIPSPPHINSLPRIKINKSNLPCSLIWNVNPDEHHPYWKPTYMRPDNWSICPSIFLLDWQQFLGRGSFPSSVATRSFLLRCQECFPFTNFLAKCIHRFHVLTPKSLLCSRLCPHVCNGLCCLSPERCSPKPHLATKMLHFTSWQP